MVLVRMLVALTALSLVLIGGSPVSAAYPTNIDQIRIRVHDAKPATAAIDGRCGVNTPIQIVAYQSTSHGLKRVVNSWITVRLLNSRGPRDFLGPDRTRLVGQTLTD